MQDVFIHVTWAESTGNLSSLKCVRHQLQAFGWGLLPVVDFFDNVYAWRVEIWEQFLFFMQFRLKCG
jgi:hypothetical protein